MTYFEVCGEIPKIPENGQIFSKNGQIFAKNGQFFTKFAFKISISLLLEEKLKQGQRAISELNKKMLQDVADATNNFLKAQGAMEHLDNLILKKRKEEDNKPEEVKKLN